MRSDSCQGTWPLLPLTNTATTALPAQRAGRTEPRTGFQGKDGNITLFSSTPLQQGKKEQPQERLHGHSAQMEPESLCSPQQSPG